MKDERKTKTELIKELVQLRKRVALLEKEKIGRMVQKDLLKQDESGFHSPFEHLALPYQSLDEKGCFLEVNQTWLDMLGYSRKEVIGRWFGDFLAPGHRSQFIETFLQFKSTGEVYGVKFELLKKDGSVRFVS